MRALLEEHRTLGVEVVRVATHFVDRPVHHVVAAGDELDVARRVETNLRAVNGWCHVAATDRLTILVVRVDVVHFLDFDSRMGAVFFEAELEPPRSHPTSRAEFALTTMSLVLTIMSGVPMRHTVSSTAALGGGMSAPGYRTAPVSARLAIFATSRSLRDGSSLCFWMPMFFSMYHGGIASVGSDAGALLDGARHGRTSS